MTTRGPIPANTTFSVATTRPIEAVSTYTPLGIQFWDMLTGEPIRRTLHVAARSCPGNGRPIASFTTPAGVHAFRNLTGLRSVEFPPPTVAVEPSDDPAGRLPESLPADEPLRYVVTVEDPSGEFSPAMVVVPAPHSGLVKTSALLADCVASMPGETVGASLPDGDPPIYLTSAPARRLPPGTAAVRAQLCTLTGEKPSHALLDLEITLPDGSTMRRAGYSDHNGAVLVAFPFPTFNTTTGPSPPPGDAGSPLDTQCWDVTARVRYDPAALVYVSDITTPTLPSIIAQAPITVWETLTVSGLEFSAQLCFPSELILKTRNHDRPDLLIGATAP